MVRILWRRIAMLAVLLLVLQSTNSSVRGEGDPISKTVGAVRAPAAPLVACDPYFSIWSPAPQLTDANTTHWTGKPHRLVSLVRIDGQNYRLMGAEPAEVPAMQQTSLTISTTRTTYQ